jgi:methylated-DNA-[protein]-cysteine S-methyltransferase
MIIQETSYFNSPLGTIELKHSGKGISSLIFVDQHLPENDPGWIFDDCKKQLKEYFEGTRTDFDLELDLQGTEFQKRVWDELIKISYGRTITYSDIAKKISDIKSIRAVGKANGSNPVSIIVPCHRVIGSDGGLTGYAGGLWRKKWLLEHEQKNAQLSLFEK